MSAGGIHVVAQLPVGAARLSCTVQQRAQRHHLALRRCAPSAARCPRPWRGTARRPGRHLLGAAEAVEVVDVERAEVDLQVSKTSVSGTPCVLAFSRSMSTSSCGTLIRKLVNRPASSGVWQAAADQRLGRLGQLLGAQAGAVLDLQLEAADRAQALHRRRREDRDEARPGSRRSCWFSAPAMASARTAPATVRSSNGVSVTNMMPALGALTKPLIDRPGNCDRVATPGCFSADLRHPADHARRCGRARRASGSWAKATRYPLSCVGTKPVGTLREAQAGQGQQPDVDREHQTAACASTPADAAGVARPSRGGTRG